MQQAALSPTYKPIPMAAGEPFLGNYREIQQKEILKFVEDLRLRYGDLVQFKVGPFPLIFVCHPDHLYHIFVKNSANYIKGARYDLLRLLMGNGLVTSEGDLWRQQRRLIQPTFTPKAVLQFHQMMVAVTQKVIERWQPMANQIIDMDKEMMRLTMGVIGEAMFTVDLNEQASEVGEAFSAAFQYIGDGTSKAFIPPLYIPTPTNVRFKRALQTIHRFIDERITYGREHPNDNNILTMLLQARDEETNAIMDEAQLRDEVITLFFAGFETTARTLTWAFYLLSQHQDKRRKLQTEVDTVLNGRLPTIEDLYRLPYTRMVADETLRIYPPTGFVARQAVADDQLGEFHLPAGSILMISPHITHRLPDLWPEPEQFRPERFESGKLTDLHKCAYVPFITGPRVCIGNNFALLEIVIALAMLSQQFVLDMPRKQLKPAFVGTTRATEPVLMQLRSR